ncbi:N-acetyltransferase [Pseudoxanthomonas sp. z9]|uniref:GNAT family N-acetyltransferase n=1 Tax=Pseudoxanthomonas sp. z9 TaxID=2584942 RepID=UPI00201DAD5E|nr:N-acetyltransferase [Pseudoxanthomonas sp. z9]MCL6712894.1 GNAT family N-acetyltransferase [Pseudomonas sp. R2.Fl]
METLRIRPATVDDLESMWTIFRAVIAPGDALPFDEDFERDTFREHWFGTHAASVAEQGDEVIGMYKLGANHAGRGAHIASATYAVAPAMQGRGVGRRLVEHSLARARAAGFRGIQFNYVVSTNAAAVELYRRLGFDIVGTLPGAFRHQRLGWVDAYVMFRALERPESDVEG